MSDETGILSNDDPGEPTNVIVSKLVQILGAHLCAVIGDTKHTSTVREWIDGVEPTIGRARILRSALRVAEALAGRYGGVTAQSWFQGANHVLTDESPAIVLKRASRAGDVETRSAERRMIRALHEFLDN